MCTYYFHEQTVYESGTKTVKRLIWAFHNNAKVSDNIIDRVGRSRLFKELR